MTYLASLGYEVHAISLPGHGKSSQKKGNINNYSFQDYLDIIEFEIDKISPKPVIIGHSMGGFFAQLISESPEMPGAVFLASVPHTGPVTCFLRMFMKRPLLALKGILTKNSSIHDINSYREDFFSPETKVDIQKYFDQLVQESMDVVFQMIKKGRPNIDKITSPSFVIAAEKDMFFSVKEEKLFAQALGAKFLLLPGQGHNIMLEPRWQEAADAINRWITEDLNLP